MAGRKRSYAPKSKKTYKKAKALVIPKPLSNNLLANMQKVSFKYSDFFSINPAIGTFANYVFSANGMFDPNITGVGHQPRGFDQLLSLFDHYVVVSSTATVKVLENTGSNDTNHWMALTLQDTPTVFGTVTDIFENRNVDWDPIYTGSRERPLKLSFSNSFLGRKGIEDPELKGSRTLNPTEQAFYHVYYGTDGGDDAGATTFRIDIVYDAMLIEPRNPAQS